MMVHRKRSIKMLWAGAAIFAATLAAFTLPFAVQAKADAQDAPPSNADCLGCHMQEGQYTTLGNGEQIPLHVDPADFGGSIHGMEGVACVDCHTDITGFPHPDKSGIASMRAYRVSLQDACKSCHEDQYTQLGSGVHAHNADNPNSPLCTDCHTPHTQKAWDTDEDGKLINLAQRAETAQICAKCHSAIYDEYATSVHGEGVLSQANADVPTCVECHGVHEIADPTTNSFRLNSPEMCGECHTDSAIMDKYGISTAVYSTYVADFHGTTVTLFAKTNPEGEVNKPVCYDCHGVHNILSTSDPQKGLQVKENMLQVCQNCHPDASENFPASWMSHYIPDSQKTPIVYWVNKFYQFFVPGVLGAMAIFVVSDIFGKIRMRGKH